MGTARSNMGTAVLLSGADACTSVASASVAPIQRGSAPGISRWGKELQPHPRAVGQKTLALLKLEIFTR